jgi:hypothetical protein
MHTSASLHYESPTHVKCSADPVAWLLSLYPAGRPRGFARMSEPGELTPERIGRCVPSDRMAPTRSSLLLCHMKEDCRWYPTPAALRGLKEGVVLCWEQKY